MILTCNLNITARKMEMKTLLVILICTMALAGCGGGGGSSAVNPFVGTASGPWSGVADGAPTTGTLSMTVANDGTATGSGTNATTGQAFMVVGTITASGVATFTYTYPDATYTGNGTLSIVAGHITGTVTNKIGGVQFGTSTIDLTRQ